jgi:hypothetical protein
MSEAIIIGLFSSIPATITAAAALIVSIRGNAKVEELHLAVNSRLTELLASVGAENRANGKAEGVEAERVRQGA